MTRFTRLTRFSRSSRYFEVVDGYFFGGYHYFFAFAGRLVGALAIDFDGGEDRRDLLDFADELLAGFLYCFGSDMFVGVVFVDGTFQVEAGGCGSQHHSAAIFLNARLQLLDLLGGLTDTYQKKAAGKRVERASVAYLEFLDAGEVADMPFQFVDNLKRCPADGLVYGDYGIQVNIDYRGRGRPRTKIIAGGDARVPN